jgi:hypothetical protein
VPGGALKVLVDQPDSEGGASLVLLGGMIVSSRGVQQRLLVPLTSLIGINAGTSAGGGSAQQLQADADLHEALRDLGGSLVPLARFDGDTVRAFDNRQRAPFKWGDVIVSLTDASVLCSSSTL